MQLAKMQQVHGLEVDGLMDELVSMVKLLNTENIYLLLQIYFAG